MCAGKLNKHTRAPKRQLLNGIVYGVAAQKNDGFGGYVMDLLRLMQQKVLFPHQITHLQRIQNTKVKQSQ